MPHVLTCEVVEVSAAGQQQTLVVGPLVRRHGGTVVVDGDTVVDEHVVAVGDDVHVPHPVVDLLGPVGVTAVAGVAGESGGHVEQGTVGDGVLVVVTGVPDENLPSETTAARVGVPTERHGVEHGLGEVQPLGAVLWWVGEVSLGGCHGGDTPEGLVIVTLGGGLVQGDVVVVLTGLVHHGGHELVVVGVVSHVVPVVEDTAPGTTGLPPVVGVGEHTDGLTVLVSGVVVHQTVRNERGSILERLKAVEVERHSGHFTQDEERRAQERRWEFECNHDCGFLGSM